MTGAELLAGARQFVEVPLPLPGDGRTALRHRRLMEAGRQNLSLARLVEAHADAVAILTEAGMTPHRQAFYGVWASENPAQSLRIETVGNSLAITGAKSFCSGAGLIDRALVTVAGPEHRLVDIDLRANAGALQFDRSTWRTNAFQETQTATVTFDAMPITKTDFVGPPGWYLERAGFWHGACGPAACWAGGAAGLLDYALQQSRSDPHTLAHLGAMHAAVWGLGSFLDSAGREIDDAPKDSFAARVRARAVRHLVEQAATGILRRITRAYGPQPLAMNQEVSVRYQELDLYLRQWHAERDLAALGEDVFVRSA